MHLNINGMPAIVSYIRIFTDFPEDSSLYEAGGGFLTLLKPSYGVFYTILDILC